MSDKPAALAAVVQAHGKRNTRPFTKAELHLLRRAIDHVDATAAALAALCTAQLPLNAAARGEMVTAANQACHVARAALRKLRPLVEAQEGPAPMGTEAHPLQPGEAP